MPRTPIACTAGTLSAASLISASLKMQTTTAADIARMPRVLSTKLLTRLLAAGHLRDELPVLVADRRHGETRLAHQLHLLELRVGLDLRQGHRLLHRLDGLEVNRDRLAV